jgi:hypothetical protein
MDNAAIAFQVPEDSGQFTHALPEFFNDAGACILGREEYLSGLPMTEIWQSVSYP